MTHLQKYIDHQTEECRTIWFPNHLAKCAATGDISNLVWDAALLITFQNPDSWNFGCRFIIHRRWLTVVGDIGEATYEWSQPISLDFLAHIDFGYFHGKCVSSEVGRKFVDWDGNIAAAYTKDRVAELKAMDEEDRGHDYDKELEVLEGLGDSGKYEYDEAASEYYNATGEGEGASTISSFGEIPHARCIGHFVGLQMAIKQLTERPNP